MSIFQFFELEALGLNYDVGANMDPTLDQLGGQEGELPSCFVKPFEAETERNRRHMYK